VKYRESQKRKVKREATKGGKMDRRYRRKGENRLPEQL